MPQKKLDASDETVRLTIRLTKRQTDGIDQKRGRISRSSYVRALIDSALSDGQPAIAYRLQFHEDEMPKRKFKVTPAKKATGECDHVWVKAGSIFDRCTKCEETRRH